ncbi:MAG TPA: hypothetical protein VHN14_25780 [Kofleriaceae bacterium]|jgi:hypothetical protein|nr:hypothetical protein [Kofleriaceae bacterium]
MIGCRAFSLVVLVDLALDCEIVIEDEVIGKTPFTLSRSSSHEMHVAVAPNGIGLAGTFR